MNKIMILGLIIIVVGFVVTGIGTFVESNWSFSNLFSKGGPYSYTVGIIGVVVVMAGIFLLTYGKRELFYTITF